MIRHPKKSARPAKWFSALLTSLLTPLLLTACVTAPAGDDPMIPEGIRVVTSTNVWGDIVLAITDNKAQVTALVTSEDQDPHSYSGTARDQLAIANADLVIGNGGGYDDFLGTLAEAQDKDVLWVYDILTGQNVSENEHVWYRFSAVAEATIVIRDRLMTLDPQNAESYKTATTAFLKDLTALEERARGILPRPSLVNALVTEPIASLLLEDMGVSDLTPTELAEAVEEELDIPPAALLEAETILQSGDIRLLVVNPQTLSTQLESLISIAQNASISIVELRETLPKDQGYLGWMAENLDALEAALG